MKHHLFIFFLLISLFFLGFTQGDKSRSQYSIPLGAYSVCTGDIDNDIYNDIIVGHLYNTQYDWTGVSILKNDNFVFNIDSIYIDGQHRSLLIDFFNDNDSLDIVTQYYINQSSAICVIFDVCNNFTNISYIAIDDYADDIAIGDVNHDSLIDIIFISHLSQYWGITYNQGNEMFSQPEYFPVIGYFPIDVAVADLNNDERDDVVICGQNTEVYFSYSSGFQQITLEQGDFKGFIKISDFNNDGLKDILAVVGLDYIPVSTIAFFRNDGNNSFTRLTDFSFQPGTNRFFVTDFNNDSLPDVLFQKNDFSGHIIYYNQGNFQLGDSQHVSVPDYGEGWRNIHCADMDNNGYNDIITVRTIYTQIPSNLDILFNDGNGNFGPDPIVNFNENNTNNEMTFRNYPNPFHDETIFEFILNEPVSVNIVIYDVQGNIICKITDQWYEKGVHRIRWDGISQTSHQCKPGIYFATLCGRRINNNTIKMIIH